MSARRQASSPPAAGEFAVHGVVRGHAVAAVNVLNARVAEPWTLGSLAQEVHLSRSQLVHAFDAAVGVSPMAYLRSLRVKQMAELPSGSAKRWTGGESFRGGDRIA
jgi:transcriptional regulator GlxA family with amidase domain